MSKKLRWTILFALVAVVVLALSACDREPDLGTEENPIIFSFVPSADAADVLADASAITDILSEKTGLVIEAVVPTSYVGAIEAMCDGEAHIGALNTFKFF